MDVQMHRAAMPATQRARVASWRRMVDGGGAAILAAYLTGLLGYLVYALTREGATWWAFASVFSVLASAIAGSVALIVLLTRIAFAWPDDAPTAAARTVMVLALVIASAAFAGAVVFILSALFDDQGVYWGPTMNAAARLGALIEGVGLAAFAALVVALAITGFRWIGRPAPVPVEAPATAAPGPPPWHPEAAPTEPSTTAST